MNTLWNSATYQQDLETTASNIVHLEQLKDTSILITGASGLIGSYIIDTLLYANETYQLGITIYGCGRNVAALEQQFPYGGDSLQFIEYDVLNTYWTWQNDLYLVVYYSSHLVKYMG